MGASGRTLSFFSETETEPSSIASVSEDIQRRITMMNRNTQIYRQRISQMRQRISTRQTSLSEILRSLSLPPTRPSVAALTQAVSELETRIASRNKDLSAILGSEAFTSFCALTSDIQHCEEESEKPKEDTREAGEDVTAMLHDLDVAKARLPALGPSDLRQMQSEIAALIQQFGQQRRRTLNATDFIIESDEAINARIQQLESTLDAERMSGTRALEIAQESAVTLRAVAATAGQRIRAALA
jgi:chromosome segregation ATPase